MNPSPCKQICSPSKITRRVLCAHYPNCLNLAVRSKWDGFSCGSCGDYQEEDTTRAADWQRQAECCGRLLKALFVDKPKKGPGDYRHVRLPPLTRAELAEIWRRQYPDEPVPGGLDSQARDRTHSEQTVRLWGGRGTIHWEHLNHIHPPWACQTESLRR